MVLQTVAERWIQYSFLGVLAGQVANIFAVTEGGFSFGLGCTTGWVAPVAGSSSCVFFVFGYTSCLFGFVFIFVFGYFFVDGDCQVASCPQGGSACRGYAWSP